MIFDIFQPRFGALLSRSTPEMEIDQSKGSDGVRMVFNAKPTLQFRAWGLELGV